MKVFDKVKKLMPKVRKEYLSIPRSSMTAGATFGMSFIGPNMPQHWLTPAADALASASNIAEFLKAYTAPDNLKMRAKLNVAEYFLQGVSDGLRNEMRMRNKIAPVALSCYSNVVDVLEAFFDPSCKLTSLVILLHGEPGTGKSYIATIAAGYRSSEVVKPDLDFAREQPEEPAQDKSARDPAEALTKKRDKPREVKAKQLAYDTDGAMVLFDEVDSVLESREGQVFMHDYLDSIRNSTAKTLVVLTTNHYEKIKGLPALRPGRVDMIVEVGDITDTDAEKICETYGVEWRVGSVEKMRASYVAQWARDRLLERIIQTGKEAKK